MTEQTVDLYAVPSYLMELYKAESQPTELDVLRALQGDGTKDYGSKMLHTLWPNRASVDEKQAIEQAKHSDFQKFVAHRMKLERAHSKVLEAKAIHERAESRANEDARTTCPVCHEIAPDNYMGRPCKRCIVVIERKLADSKLREAAVDKWLKTKAYDWLSKS